MLLQVCETIVFIVYLKSTLKQFSILQIIINYNTEIYTETHIS